MQRSQATRCQVETRLKRISSLIFFVLVSGCGQAEDLVRIKFYSPRPPGALSLSEQFLLGSFEQQFVGNCTVTGPEGRVIIKGPGVPGGENIINLPGSVSVPSGLLATASGATAISPFSVFVPKGDQRVIAVSMLVEHSGGNCNSANNDPRHLVAGFVGPISIQSDVSLPISLHTLIVPISAKIAISSPSTPPVTSSLRVAKLTGLGSCSSLQAGATISDSVHSALGSFPLFNPSGTGTYPVFIYPVAPNRTYHVQNLCSAGHSIHFTTGALMGGTPPVQNFACTGSSPEICTLN